jgi:hypothetical protein
MGEDHSDSRQRLREFATNALLVIAATAVALAGVEVLLRVRPALLGPTFANGVLSKYTDRDGGIFYKDRQAQTQFMIPNFTAQMYFNGYVWTHQTDALGFRNKTLRLPSDIALLGDSYIYGHGVDFESTVGFFLERQTGLSVANLARQGDCTLQQAYLVTEFLPVFQPRYVFYFFFENDIPDLYIFLDDAAMQAFIDQPPEGVHYAHRLDPAQALRERDERSGRRSLLTRLKQWSYVYRASRWLQWHLGLRAAMAAPPRRSADPTDEQSLGWRYTKKAILYMRDFSRRQGARFAIVPITPTTARHQEILRRFAAVEGIDFVDTAALTVAEGSLWLAGDGHFSPEGAQRFAERAAAYVAAHPSAPRRAADHGARADTAGGR